MPWKIRAAPAHPVAEPGPCCRELPLSDLYHTVAVTAIRDRFQPVEKRIFLNCANSGARIQASDAASPVKCDYGGPTT